MKKIITFGILICFFVYLTGCSVQSVKDVNSIVDANNIVKKVENTNAVQRNLANEGSLEQIKTPDSKLNIVSFNQEFEQYGFLGCVESSLLTENVNDVTSMTDEDSFADWLIETKGPKSHLGIERCWILSDGTINELKTKKFLFIKIKLKNTMNRNVEICMWPSVYYRNDADFVAIRSGIEGMGYDKNMVYDDPDGVYHTFQPGEELETVMAFQLNMDITQYSDVFISAAFLKEHQSENQLPEGCSMMRLEFDNDSGSGGGK